MELILKTVLQMFIISIVNARMCNTYWVKAGHLEFGLFLPLKKLLRSMKRNSHIHCKLENKHKKNQICETWFHHWQVSRPTWGQRHNNIVRVTFMCPSFCLFGQANDHQSLNAEYVKVQTGYISRSDYLKTTPLPFALKCWWTWFNATFDTSEGKNNWSDIGWE